MILSQPPRSYVVAIATSVILLIAVIVNITLTPDNYVTSGLFTIAVVLAAYCFSRRTVAIVDAIAIGSYLFTVWVQQNVPTSVWPVGVFGLSIVGLLGMSVARQREVAGRLTHEARRHAQEADGERHRMERLLSLVSHELRGALTPVMVSVQLLQRRDNDTRSERDRSMLSKIADGTERLNRMITDLSETHHLQRGVLHVQPRPMDLAATVREAVTDVRRATNRRITVDTPEHLDGVWDSVRLYQVVRNLVSNAAKYSPDDSEVHVHVYAAHDDVMIEVSDHGEGIAPADQKRLFEPFLRFSDKNAAHGMGLGLFITKGIVDAHGGSIRVKSEIGRGTTFTVILPIPSNSLTTVDVPATGDEERDVIRAVAD